MRGHCDLSGETQRVSLRLVNKKNQGSGCGCWLDAIYVLHPQFVFHPALPREIIRQIVEEAFTISPESTVTDTELSALEALIRGTRLALMSSWIRFSSSRWASRGARSGSESCGFP